MQTKSRPREYCGGYYQYREMSKPEITAVYLKTKNDIDYLPCTMLVPIVTVIAENKRAALALIQAEIDKRSNK